MILTSYSDLRHHFARVARTTGVSLTFAAGPPGIISRGAGSFVTDGYTAGMSVDVSGSANNDGRYTIESVAALALTVTEALQVETVTCALTGAEYENDGAEKWPLDLVRAAGFSSTFVLSPLKITQLPALLTVNGLATDAVAGSSYRWYVRQRTDDAAVKWLDPTIPDMTRTGSLVLSLTDKAVADMGLASKTSKLTAEQQVRLLRNVTIFCRRDSDGAIQFVDLLQLSHGAVA